MIQIDRKYVNTALLKKYRIEDTQKKDDKFRTRKNRK